MMFAMRMMTATSYDVHYTNHVWICHIFLNKKLFNLLKLEKKSTMCYNLIARRENCGAQI